MKNTLLMALGLLLLGACTKEAGDLQAFRPFAGTWEAEQFIGFPGNVTLPPGNGRILVLETNGMMESRRNDTVLYRGRYFLQYKQDCHPRESSLYFTTNDSSFLWESYIQTNGDKLTLSTSNCLADGGSTIYRRIK
ncbi:MAG TPA: hypothetical protein VGE66_14425 [Chitinophagaceae bacterium]